MPGRSNTGVADIYLLGLPDGRSVSAQLVCDRQRHLAVVPYSLENLHAAARLLGIARCWFHGDHYDLPKRRAAELTARCQVLSPRDVWRVIHGHCIVGKLNHAPH